MTAAFTILAVTAGSFVIVAFCVVMFFAVVYGFFTYSGSAINPHPNDGLDGSPGSEGPSNAAGQGRSTGDKSPGIGAGDTFSTHGTD